MHAGCANTIVVHAKISRTLVFIRVRVLPLPCQQDILLERKQKLIPINIIRNVVWYHPFLSLAFARSARRCRSPRKARNASETWRYKLQRINFVSMINTPFGMRNDILPFSFIHKKESSVDNKRMRLLLILLFLYVFAFFFSAHTLLHTFRAPHNMGKTFRFDCCFCSELFRLFPCNVSCWALKCYANSWAKSAEWDERATMVKMKTKMKKNFRAVGLTHNLAEFQRIRKCVR